MTLDAWTTDLPPVDGKWYWMRMRHGHDRDRFVVFPVKSYKKRRGQIWIDTACYRRCAPEYLLEERQALFSRDPIPSPPEVTIET